MTLQVQAFSNSNTSHINIWSPPNALFPSTFLLYVQEQITNLLKVLEVMRNNCSKRKRCHPGSICFLDVPAKMSELKFMAYIT